MPIRTLDHFLILVDPLEPAAATCARLGFHVRPIAQHLDLGSANCVIHLRDTYLELLFLGDAPPVFQHQYRPRLAAGQGLAHVSLNSRSLEADRERLAAAGLQPGPIVSARRAIMRPDGRVDETASSFFYIWRDEHRYMSLFQSFHAKPDTIFIDAYTEHANTAADVVRLVYMSDDPARDLGYFTALFEGPPATVGPDGFSFVGPRGEITEVMTVMRATARYGANLPGAGLCQLGGLPVALHYSVGSVARCTAYLQSQGVPLEPFDGGVVVAADGACGVTTVFEPMM